jgi:hypothetical protein
MIAPAALLADAPTPRERRAGDFADAGSVLAPAPLAKPVDVAKQHAASPVSTTPAQTSLLPPRVVIELDAAAERFVQTLVDGAGGAVLRRYPDEAQLAFSRGVNAYIAALTRR